MMMEPRVNLWVEIGDQVVLSRWRVRLLKTIAETGSISQAARHMGVSYRRAWEKIHEMEQRLGVTLLDTQTGGEGGGGACLTDSARDYIACFQKFSQGIDDYVAHLFQDAFGSLDGVSTAAWSQYAARAMCRDDHCSEVPQKLVNED